MKKLGVILVLIPAVLGFFSCEKKDVATNETAEVSFAGNYAFGGSTTVEPIVRAAAESFVEIFPEVKISYDAPGSSAGVKGAMDGTYTLGAASRSLKDSEKDAGVIATPVAYDGVAVIVNKDSVGVDDLSKDDVIAIYAGEITNWSELGGDDAEIVVFNRDEASGTRSCFKDATVKKAKKDFVETAAIVTSNGDMVSKVGSTPYAIGYCGFGYLGRDPGTKPLNIGGVEPKEANVLDESYPISRSLILVTMGAPVDGSLEKAFIDYILSTEGQEIVVEEKFISITQ